MNTALILKIIGVGLLVCVGHQVMMRAGREEQAMLLSLSGVIIVLLMLVGELSSLFTMIRNLFGI